MQLILNAFAEATGLNFQEDPVTDAKDSRYRLYTKVEVVASCCSNAISKVELVDTDKDAGFETTKWRGTIELEGLHLSLTDDGCAMVGWLGYGHPDPGVEWTFQAIHPRSSINIWHRPTVKICCVNGETYAYENGFRGSRFPSHRIWIDGSLENSLKEGKFHSLWRSDRGGLGEDFVTEDGKGPFVATPYNLEYPWFTRNE